MSSFFRLYTVVFLLLGLPVLAGAVQQEEVAVLFSREIAPYVTAVTALEERLRPRQVVRFFLDDRGRPYSLEARHTSLDPQRFSAVVAIGPEALRYLQPAAGSTPLVFGMVLDPKPHRETAQPLCGVNLTLPMGDQLAHIRRLFPDRQRLGVLFDPDNNQSWFDQAHPLARAMGLSLVPLNVSREGGRFDIIGALSTVDTLLFIPDRSIISRAVIQHVIKQGLQSGKPAVGFNRFFLDSGAALAFIIDYEEVGRQVAQLVLRQLDSGCATIDPPVFSATVNDDVLRLLRPRPAGGAP